MTLVMVVDDDQDLAEMLSIVLTGAGMKVDLVNRGDLVIDRFNASPPDLVLLDVMLLKPEKSFSFSGLRWVAITFQPFAANSNAAASSM